MSIRWKGRCAARPHLGPGLPASGRVGARTVSECQGPSGWPGQVRTPPGVPCTVAVPWRVTRRAGARWLKPLKGTRWVPRGLSRTHHDRNRPPSSAHWQESTVCDVCVCGCVSGRRCPLKTATVFALSLLGACTHCQVPGASAHLPPTRKEGRKRRPLRLAAHIRPSHPPALSPPSIHQHQHQLQHHSITTTTTHPHVQPYNTLLLLLQPAANTLPTRAPYRSHLPLDSASSAQSQHIPVLRAHRRLLPVAHRTLVAPSQSHHQTTQPPNHPDRQQ